MNRPQLITIQSQIGQTPINISIPSVMNNGVGESSIENENQIPQLHIFEEPHEELLPLEDQELATVTEAEKRADGKRSDRDGSSPKKRR